MAQTIRCTNCGSFHINVTKGNVIGVCQSCGAKLLFPELKNNEVIALLNQAYVDRSYFKFDDAIHIYEHILSMDPDEHTALLAYEGLLLSKYGITYTKEGSRYIPSLSRYNPQKVDKNPEYKEFVNRCHNKEVLDIFYERFGEIEKLQHKVSRQVEKAEDYDVFISFKSTDSNGHHTEDGRIARAIYDRLTATGYDVFMSDVSLKKYVAEEYEPIIYNALDTSEFFILVGTSEDNVNAPWVKNEWSRYFDRMRDPDPGNAKFRKYIPVFKGMSAYDMPRIGNSNIQGVDAEESDYLDKISNTIKKIEDKNGVKVSNNDSLRNVLNIKRESNQKNGSTYHSNVKRYNKKRAKLIVGLSFAAICITGFAVGIYFAVQAGIAADKAREEQEIAMFNNLIPTRTSTQTEGFTIDNLNCQYSFMIDSCHVYIATPATNDSFKVDRWNKPGNSTKDMKFEKPMGAFKINDAINNFAWIDNEQTCFRVNLIDNDNSFLKNKGKNVVFTINLYADTSNTNKGTDYYEKIACYSFEDTNKYKYRAIPITDTFVKFECWHEESDSHFFWTDYYYLFNHAVRVVNINSEETDIQWSEYQKSFIITIRDCFNVNWGKTEKLVSFSLENPNYEYSSVLSCLIGQKLKG